MKRLAKYKRVTMAMVPNMVPNMVAYTVACSILVSCAKGGGSGTADTYQSPTPDSATVREVGYDIDLRQRDEGCPDVAEFFSRLSTLPEDGWVRRHTVSFKPAVQNEDGSKPRTNFVSVVAFSSFEISEKRVGEFRMELGTFEQTACQSLRATETGVGTRDYVIRASTPSSIRMALAADPADPADPTKDDVTMDLEWIGPRELRVRSSYLAMDMCPDYKPLRVERTQSIQWGPADFPATNTTADVDPAFISRAIKPLASVPSSLSALGTDDSLETNAGTLQTTAVSVSDLRKLRDSQLRTDMMVCPYRAKPPSGDEPPPPDETVAPTPTPAPDTGAIPEPQPAG